MTADAAGKPTLEAADTARLLERLKRWRLRPDGAAFATASSLLQPVLSDAGDGRPAMLKLARASAAGDEERAGFALQRWWDGRGAAGVYRHDEDAVLLERARGRRSLAAMSLGPSAADDDHALRLLCRSVAVLHVPRPSPPPTLVPLDSWFGELFEHADDLGGSYLRGADLAAELLDEQAEAVPLHGDIHHGNVLDFDHRGWLAIDPKGLLGAAEFDYANMLCNPSRAQSAEPRRLRRRVQTVALASGIDADRLLRWTIAWTALSATWFATADDAGSADALATVAIGEAATRILLDSAL
ncbi:streptomycin 6-kinase [Microterricola gilva]|uniref:Streptomycin 6-kinase n=1 Tax=Microterricola gilva TaxID=393267 RepID=A0A4Q8AQE4_9MICO|nr:aminoglycoside phosphotransferase family protein [Microterricola gilva]RZU66343.1 streptomycin 6-kinase [Microterricola gilva]